MHPITKYFLGAAVGFALAWSVVGYAQQGVEGSSVPMSFAEVVVGGTPGTSVGGFASGNLRVTGQSADVNGNAVVSGHNLNGGNKQLWYFGSCSSSNDALCLINRQNSDLVLQTNNTERMRIEPGGDVGIGTSSPLDLLHLRSAAPTLYIETSGATNANIILEDTDEDGCTEITVLDGVVSGVTVTCPI